MDKTIEGLVNLIDQAIEIAEQRLSAKCVGVKDPASVGGLERIIQGLRYRREEALSKGYEIQDSDRSLGLARAALEYDAPDSLLIHKIGDIEKYFQRHYNVGTSN